MKMLKNWSGHQISELHYMKVKHFILECFYWRLYTANILNVKSTDICLFVGTSHQDQFKYSTDPIWQVAYKERIEPYLDNYALRYE